MPKRDGIDKRIRPDSRVTTHCPECGKEFWYYKSWPRKYCCRRCAAQHIANNIKHWQPSAFETTCEQCGKPFVTTPKRTRGRFCSYQCFGEWMKHHAPTGGDHPNWRGGYEPYYGSNWRQQRRAARHRDGYKCQRCGITEDELGKALDVHHIKPFREFNGDNKSANSLKNLICLCNKCHATLESATNHCTNNLYTPPR